MFMPGQRQPSAELEPPWLYRPGPELSAVHRHALAHPDQAVTAIRRGGLAASVVGHDDLDRVRLVAQQYLGLLRACMLESVRQTLLHEPVGREVEDSGERYRFTFDPKLHREPRLADAVDQLGELLESGLRRERGCLVGIS